MAASSEMKKGSHLLVAAFDFGTTYSGYAFSFRSKPSKIQANQNWAAGSSGLISLKTPTSILLDPEERFHSFGFEAENKYFDLAEDDKHHDWLFFRRFKMILHNNKKLSRQTIVRDINGKMMLALDIFAMSIHYLQYHLFEMLKTRAATIEESDIKYVITIPAIWDDSGKQFMRLAAIQAGLDTKRVILALEPEAASIWCQTLTAEGNDSLSKPGTQYMVVDLGESFSTVLPQRGGTADISVHEKNKDGTLKELHIASGGPWGGMYVDNNYIKWLEKLFGVDPMERFKKECMADYFEMLREFESNKRSFRFDSQEYMSFKIPPRLRELSVEETSVKFEQLMNFSCFASSISIKRDKIRIKSSVVQSWFDGPVDDVVTHIQEILGGLSMEKVSYVLLVGGFGENVYVQDKVKTAIPNKRLIIPGEAGLTVLKGAVRFGHQPSLLSSRILKHSYGLEIHRVFDEKNDDASRMISINGQQIVCDNFLAFVNAGENIEIGHQCKKCVYPTNIDCSTLPLYRSLDPSPSFTTDPGCEHLGTLTVYHPEGETLTDKKMEIMMLFGDTEIKVKAKIKKTQKECSTVLDML